MKISREKLSPNLPVFNRSKQNDVITNEVCAAITSRSLMKEFKETRGALKKLAAAGNWSLKAVSNWFYGKNAPRMQDLIILMAECETLHEEVLRLVEERRNGHVGHNDTD